MTPFDIGIVGPSILNTIVYKLESVGKVGKGTRDQQNDRPRIHFESKPPFKTLLAKAATHLKHNSIGILAYLSLEWFLMEPD